MGNEQGKAMKVHQKQIGTPKNSRVSDVIAWDDTSVDSSDEGLKGKKPTLTGEALLTVPRKHKRSSSGSRRHRRRPSFVPFAKTVEEHHDDKELLHPDAAEGDQVLAVHTSEFHDEVSRHNMKDVKARKYAKFVEPIQSTEHVEKLDANDVRMLAESWDEFSQDGKMTSEQFQEAIHSLSDKGWAHLDTPFGQRLFELCDQGEKGFLDQSDYDEGMALMCVGTLTEKVRLTFQVFDKRRHGLVGAGDMFRACKVAFQHALNAAIEDSESIKAEVAALRKQSGQIVRDYVDAVFSKYCHHRDHFLRFSEFASWLSHDPTISVRFCDSHGAPHTTFFSLTHSGCGAHGEVLSLALAEAEVDALETLSSSEAWLRQRGVWVGHGAHAGMVLEEEWAEDVHSVNPSPASSANPSPAMSLAVPQKKPKRSSHSLTAAELSAERKAYRAKKRAFQAEKAAFKAKKMDFSTKKAAFNAERLAFGVEKAAFEAEKAAWIAERDDYEAWKASKSGKE